MRRSTRKSTAADSPDPSQSQSQVSVSVGEGVQVGKHAVGDGQRWAVDVREGKYNVELLQDRKPPGRDEVEYFIRVLGRDRRMDRWVPESCVVGPATNTAVNADADRKGTNGARATPPPLATRNSGTKRPRATGSRRPTLDDQLQVFRIHDGVTADEQAAEHSSHLREVKYIEKCVIGDHIIDAWYPSPFPHKLLKREVEGNGGLLFVDDLTLKYTGSAARMLEHKQSQSSSILGLRGPPGIALYDYGQWSLWEIDGGEGFEYNNELIGSSSSKEIANQRALETAHRELYCQNMGLLSKLFLDHKQEYFTTSNFVYYVLTERYEREDQRATGRPYDSRTLRPAVGGVDHLFRGYFSREKGQTDYNLSCIMVLPPWQRYGVGRMLIHFSYLLAGREPRTKRGLGAGTPERPMSELGKHVYLQFWKSRVALFLKEWKKAGLQGTVADIIGHTGLEKKDVLKALHALDVLMDGLSSSGSATLEIDWDFDAAAIDALLATDAAKKYPVIEPSELCHVGQCFGAGDDDESYEV